MASSARLFIPFLSLSIAWACTVSNAKAEGDWSELRQDVEARRTKLASLIARAESAHLNTDYAEVSMHVITTFQKAAQHDHDSLDEVRAIFDTFGWARKSHPDEADKLATNELNACLEVADHSIAELRNQLAAEIILPPTPDFTNGRLKFETGGYFQNIKPVFPSSLVWIEDDSDFFNTFGHLGGGFFQLSHLNKDSTLSDSFTTRVTQSIAHQKELHASPFVFLLGHQAAGWMSKQHPEITKGERNFTRYDIDSPLIRDWLRKLCTLSVPLFKKACGDAPIVYLLANEPHFATEKGGWKAVNGVSDFTIAKYRKWITKTYGDIASLNQSHASNFESLDQVTIDLPISPKLRGSAIYYDWCRFNMDRVNDWFSFLKEQVQAHDPDKSPTSIKLIGHSLTGELRDHGIDFEFLTKLQEIPGSDLRVVPQGATLFGKHEVGLDPETHWKSYFAYDWSDQSMVLDFSKSICPEKPFYDSEWHGFSAVSWRHFKLDRDYVRSALWMAFSDGMSMIQPWVWGRNPDGSLNPKTDHIGELATQPIALDAYGRVMKELNAHATHVKAASPSMRHFMIYYCEESAIQDAEYIPRMKQVYESLKLTNVSIGFTTPSEIGKLDPQSQNLIVTPTDFISDMSLTGIQKFQISGGSVVEIVASENFTRTEHGAPRTNSPKLKTFITLPLEATLPLAAKFESSLAKLIPEHPIKISIADKRDVKAFGVIARQSVIPETEKHSVILNNLSKEVRVVTLTNGSDHPLKLINDLTGQAIGSPVVMKPCDVFLLTAEIR